MAEVQHVAAATQRFGERRRERRATAERLAERGGPAAEDGVVIRATGFRNVRKESRDRVGRCRRRAAEEERRQRIGGARRRRVETPQELHLRVARGGIRIGPRELHLDAGDDRLQVRRGCARRQHAGCDEREEILRCQVDLDSERRRHRRWWGTERRRSARANARSKRSTSASTQSRSPAGQRMTLGEAPAGGGELREHAAIADLRLQEVHDGGRHQLEVVPDRVQVAGGRASAACFRAGEDRVSRSSTRARQGAGSLPLRAAVAWQRSLVAAAREVTERFDASQLNACASRRNRA